MEEPVITIRAATVQDAELIWEMRNAPDVRSASRTSQPIPLDSHKAWFTASLENPDREFLIAEIEGQAIGMIRLDRQDDYAEINIIVADHVRGQRKATPMLKAALDVATTRPKIWRAVVKPENTASLALFERLGFQEVSRDSLVTFERTADQ